MSKRGKQTWRGHTVHSCPQCAYTTLHEDKLADHLAKAHPQPRRPRDAPQEPAQLDPLGELSNDDYEQLTPAEKGARTRQANEEAQQQDAQSGEKGDE